MKLFSNILLSLTLSLLLVSTVKAAGNASAGEAKAVLCTACHGADGNSAIANFPKLAGQSEKYLLKQLQEIKAGKRAVVEMTGLLDALSSQDLADIAAYFSKQNIQKGQAAKDQVALGKQIYRAGIAKKAVAACTACHSPTGSGNVSAGFPAIAGQHSVYTEKQLKLFRNAERTNDPNGMMRDIAAKLSDAEIKAVAAYIQGLN